ncbi:hypothetical protein JW906_14365, partial [bacterium]|nr:hypothetical protein [bacterium]
NRIQWRNGQLEGAWVPRYFDFPVVVPLSDAGNGSLQVHALSGRFIENGAAIQIDADLEFPPIVPGPSIILDLRQPLTLSPGGLFSGTEAIAGSIAAIPWGASGLTLNPGIRPVVSLSGESGVQQAGLAFNGSITLPSCSGPGAVASGSGVYDFIDGTLQSGRFTFAGNAVFCVPSDHPVFTFQANSGGTVSASGLAFEDGGGSLLFQNGSQIPCHFSKVGLSLPSWSLDSGEIGFQGRFGLNLSSFHGEPADFRWEATSFDAGAAGGADNVFMNLPDNARITDGILQASGETASTQIWFTNLMHNCSAVFSGDYRMQITPPRIIGGRIDFVSENGIIATCDQEGMHFGDAFGSALVAENILLPSLEIGYIPLTNEIRGRLDVQQEGDRVRVTTLGGQKVQLMLPAFAAGGDVPSADIALNLVVDPRTGRVHSDQDLKIDPDPDLDLSSQGYPFLIRELIFTRDHRLTASLSPILPLALRSAALKLDSIPLAASGPGTFSRNYNLYQAVTPPLASVRLGDCLQVSLDGVHYLSSEKRLRIAGNLHSPFFQDQTVHFVMEWTPAGAVFLFPGGGAPAFTIGAGRLSLLEQNGGPGLSIYAPMDAAEFQVSFAALLSLFETFELTLPLVRIEGKQITFDMGDQPQSTRLFGADLGITGATPVLSPENQLRLALQGSIRLFGEVLPFDRFQVGTEGSIEDGLLYTRPAGSDRTAPLSAVRLSTAGGHLRIVGRVMLPDPFEGSEDFTVLFTPSGAWKDTTGISQPVLTVVGSEAQGAATNLGKDDDQSILVPMKIAALTIENQSSSNSAFDGQIELVANAYWPNPAQPVLWQTRATLSVNSEGRRIAWTIPGVQADTQTPNPAEIPINNVLFNKAKDLTVECVNDSFAVLFTSDCGIPGAGIFKGLNAEFKENKIRKDAFQRGRFDGAEFDLLIFRVQVSNVNWFFGKNGQTRDIDIKDISFDPQNANVQPHVVKATKFLSFSNAILDGEFVYLSGGIEEFRYVETSDRNILFIKKAHLRIPNKLWAELDLLADIKDDQDFRFLVGGTCNLDAFKGEEAFVGATLVGLAEMKDGRPGFGAFFAVHTTDIAVAPPIPITMDGFGAGFFVNTNDEVDRIIRSHLQMGTDGIDKDFEAMLGSLRGDNPRSYFKLMIYAKINFPESDGLSCLSLWTLGTDRVRVDVKLTGIGSKLKSLKDFMDFYGSGFIEAAWKQDMSGFDYLAGIVTLSATPVVNYYAKDTKLEDTYASNSLITFDVGKATVKLIIAPSSFALHGLISAKTPFFYNLMEAEVALSTYGFFIRGKYAVGFDLLIVSAEAGLELALYVDHPPNTDLYEWGGYGNAYIQADVLGGFVASARGDLYLGMFAENLNFYLFGTAILQASVFGIKSSTGLWAKWETGGGFDAGFGVNEEMMAKIETCRGKANEIYSAALNVQGAEINVTGLDQLSQNIYQLVSNYKDRQFLDWNLAAMGFADPYLSNDSQEKAHLGKIKNFYNDFINTLGPFQRFAQVWLSDDKYTAPVLWGEKAEQFKSAFVNQRLTDIDLALESQLEQVEINPIEQAYQQQTATIGGTSIPYAKIDEARQSANRDQVVLYGERLPALEQDTWNHILKIRAARDTLYAALSTGSGNSLGSIMGSIQKGREPGGLMLHIDELALVQAANNFLQNQANQSGTLLPGEAQIDQLVNDEWRRLNSSQRKYCHTCRLYAIQGKNSNADLTLVESVTEAEYKNTAKQMYLYAPYALLNAYSHQVGNIYRSYHDIWNAGQATFDEAAVDLTAKTDALWDKYYSLTENYYQLLKDFHEMRLQGAGRTTLQQNALSLWSQLGTEFRHPNLVIQVAVQQPPSAHFNYLSASFSSNTYIGGTTFSSAKKLDWAETQVGFGNGYQSIGKLSPYRRHVFIHPDINSPDVSVEGIAYETVLFGNEEATETMGIRIRNAAGQLVQWPQTYTLNFRLPAGTIGATETGSNNITSIETAPDFDLTVHLPDVHTMDLFSRYISGEINTLRLAWMVPADMPERISKYQVRFKRPSSADFLTPWLMTGVRISKDRFYADDPSIQGELDASALFEGTLTHLQFTAAGEYVLRLEALDLKDRILQTGEIRLLVDKSPPVWQTAAVEIQEDRAQWKCRAAIPAATDQNSYITDFPVNGYEARIIPEGVPPDSAGWNSIENLDVTNDADGHPAFINLGSLPYRKSLDIAFRVKNRFWDSGYSNVLTRHIDRLAETQNPLQAEFQFVRMDEDTNIVFRVTRTPADALSGVDRFTAGVYREESALVNGLYFTGTVMPWKPEEVAEDRFVVLPTGSWRDDVYGALRFVVSTWDRSGNHTACPYMWTRLPPRPPSDFRAWMASGRVVVAGTFDEKMVQDHVQSLLITVIHHTDSLSFEMDCRDVGGSLWYAIPKLTSYERSWNVSSLIPGGAQAQLQVICRAKQWNPHQQRYQYATAVAEEVMTYPSMFTTVLTGEDGNLMIPFENEGFGGQRQVDYYAALGRIQGGSPVFDLRAFPSQADFRGVQVSPGARLALPVQANDCWPRTLVAVKAVDLSGKNCQTQQEVALVPGAPWLNVSPYIEKQFEGVSSAVNIATGQETVQTHYQYSLVIPPQALDR